MGHVDGWPSVESAQAVARELVGLIPQDCIHALKGEPLSGAGASAGGAAASIRLQGVSGESLRDELNGGIP